MGLETAFVGDVPARRAVRLLALLQVSAAHAALIDLVAREDRYGVFGDLKGRETAAAGGLGWLAARSRRS